MLTFALFDTNGTALTGATPTFTVYADGSGAARTHPTITEIGGGLYRFSPTSEDARVGVGYLIDGGASAEPRYASGSVGLLVAFAFYDSSGAPLPGLTPTFAAYQDADGDALTEPAIVALGGGVYAFQPTQQDRNVAANYIMLGGGAAEPASYSGEVPSGQATSIMAPAMRAISRHISIEQGATWSQTFAAVDSTGASLDLTGYTPRMEIRTARGGALIATATVAVTSAVGGLLVASLTAAQTELLSYDGGAYDLEVESSGTVLRLFSGCVRISPEVTTL